MKILLVEDDSSIVSALSELLGQEGFAVDATGRQDAACEMSSRRNYDLALVDISLEQGNGFAVCAALRDSRPDIPVIFLTASSDEYSTVAGLEAGAVDYVPKPFRPRELVARVRNALRKNERLKKLELQNISIDPSSALVTKNGREIALSALEYRILLLFAQNAGKLVTRDAIRNAIWDSAGEYVSDNTLNVYIKRLREKIEDDPAMPETIVTVRGLGYKTKGNR